MLTEMARPFWRLKQMSVPAISPHVWKLPLLVNLWLAVTAAALTTAVHKRTQYETSLVPFTAAVLVVLLCPLNLVWLKLAARYHKPSNATSQQSRPPPLDGGSRGPPKQKSRTVMVVYVCSSEKRSSPHCKVVRTVVCVLVILRVLFLLLLLAGDVERNPGPTVVTMDRAPELAALLVEVAAQWNLLFSELGVSHAELDQMEADSAGQPNMDHHCLTRGLHLWVRSEENPTYEKIIAVLRGPVVIDKPLAVKVEEFAQSVSSGSRQERISSQASGTVVTVDKVDELAALINGDAAQWYLVFSQLGVSFQMLERIKLDSAGQPNMAQHCLTRGLHHWVRSDKSPTYEKIVAVFNGNFLTNKPLAMKVEVFAQSVSSGSRQERISSQASGTVVTVDKVDELAALIAEGAPDWFLFFTQLGVSFQKLDQMKADSAGQPNMAQHCLTRGLHQWVRSCKSPTYEKIVAVLRGPVVIDIPLAMKVEEFAQSVSSGSRQERISSQASGTVVTVDKVDELAALIAEVAPVWDLALMQFGVSSDKLVQIRADSAGQPNVDQLCLTRGLHHWVRSEETPTYEKIIAALRTHVISRSVLARKVEEFAQSVSSVASLEKGYVTIRSLKVVLTGAGGAGKTSTLNTLLGRPHLPYTSSGATTNAVRKAAAVSVGSVKGEDKWISDSELLAKVYASAEGKKETKNAPNQDYHNGRPNEEFQRAPNGNPSSPEVRQEILAPERETGDINPASEGESGDIIPTSERETSDTKEKQIDPKLISIAAEFRRSAESLMRENTDAPLKEFNVLHFLDSGGQVQFHEILHKFVGELNASVFVSDLNHRPESNIEEQFFVEGKSLGNKYTSEYTHEQLLKRTLQALQQHSGSKIAIVATHLDDFKKLSKEELSKQTKWIRDHVLNSSFHDGARILEKEADDFVFYLNASKDQSEDDKRIAECLLEKLKEMFKTATVLNIPIAHFALEQTMREYGNTRKGIVTVAECEQMAAVINREVPAEETLEFLRTRNLVLQFKNIDALKDLVFCDVQTLLNIVTEIVRVSAVRRGECGSLDDIGSQFDTPEFKRKGVITEVDLNHKDFYKTFFKEIEDIFTPALFLTLMENIQIIGKMSADSITTSDASTADPDPINSSGEKLVCEYIIPCILREMPEGDIVAYRMPADAEVAPLLLYFGEWPQSGVFCTLIAGLVSKQKWIPKPFQRKDKKRYLYRNCMNFEVPDISCNITLVESYHSGYFEVHIEDCDDYNLQDLSAMCPAIRRALYTVLENESLLFSDAVFCPYKRCKEASPHAATISREDIKLRCTSMDKPFACTDIRKYKHWFDPPANCQVSADKRAHELQCLEEEEGERAGPSAKRRKESTETVTRGKKRSPELVKEKDSGPSAKRQKSTGGATETSKEEYLDRTMEPRDVRKICRKVLDWGALADYLNFDDAKKAHIAESRYSSNERVAVIQEWQRELGCKATFRALWEVALEMEDQKLAERIEKIAKGQ